MKKSLSVLLSFIILFSTVFCSGAVSYGDIDGNGNVTVDDARAVLRYAVKLETPSAEQATAADVDKSGVVTVDDARAVLRVAVKLDTPFGDITGSVSEGTFDYSLIPAYSGILTIEVNNNIPYFTESEIEGLGACYGYEYYSALDDLGRCGYCEALVGEETLPTEKRGDISSVKPSGWKQNMYDNSLVEGSALYNRSHLIGYQLTAENANECNLITGTRYLNATGMLEYENKVAKYIDSTNNHVLYRVTPVFVDDELVARGVLMEAFSTDDNGAGVRFCVFVYNVQPGIYIDYKTGDNRLDSDSGMTGSTVSDEPESSETGEYILNTKTKKFHLPTCGSADTISPENRSEFRGSRDELVSGGYSPCKNCNP